MKTYIIAEAGVNHNGDIHIAKRLIDAAAESGADAVKFQTFKTDKLVSKTAPKAEYQKESTETDESQYDMIKKLELDRSVHEMLQAYCEEKGIDFLSSPFDLDSIDLLNELGLELFKIPSGEITNLPYLRKVGRLSKRVILSTGMADMSEIRAALDVIEEAGTHKDLIQILHCNSEYPTPYEDVNLLAMLHIKSELNVSVGYSDHTTGIEVPVAAVALGASVIEKHFTLDRKMPGPDHRASLEPHELKSMVRAIRNIEGALGESIKRPSPSEIKNRMIVRKSIVAKTDIQRGERLSEDNLTTKRPASGISPMEWDSVVGTCAVRDFSEGSPIEL